MSRFFTEEWMETSSGKQAVIIGPDAMHISRVLRMKAGEELTVCDLRGNDFLCRLEQADPARCVAAVLSQQRCATEPECRVTLFQALPKGDKMDWIVQKATELGVCAIHPMRTERCVSRPDEASLEKKRQRYQKIAAEAAKQSQRGVIPQLLEAVTFAQAVALGKNFDVALFFYEEGGDSLRCLVPPGCKSAAIYIGSEGGFSAAEALLARENGLHAATLGKRILRCETAPLAALSALFFHTGEF